MQAVRTTTTPVTPAVTTVTPAVTTTTTTTPATVTTPAVTTTKVYIPETSTITHHDNVVTTTAPTTTAVTTTIRECSETSLATETETVTTETTTATAATETATAANTKQTLKRKSTRGPHRKYEPDPILAASMTDAEKLQWYRDQRQIRNRIMAVVSVQQRNERIQQLQQDVWEWKDRYEQVQQQLCDPTHHQANQPSPEAQCTPPPPPPGPPPLYPTADCAFYSLSKPLPRCINIKK
jgi:hypothetical protein